MVVPTKNQVSGQKRLASPGAGDNSHLRTPGCKEQKADCVQ